MRTKLISDVNLAHEWFEERKRQASDASEKACLPVRKEGIIHSILLNVKSQLMFSCFCLLNNNKIIVNSWHSCQICIMTNVMMSSRKSQVIQLYREILRLAKTWEAKVPSETAQEKDFIRSEARLMFRANKNISSDQEIDKKLEEGRNRLEIARHYRIPYPRPVYYATGSVTRMEKKRLAAKSKWCKPSWISLCFCSLNCVPWTPFNV